MCLYDYMIKFFSFISFLFLKL